ncbi:MAG TPA: hypothetical protein VKE27_10025 [Candidatus Dormibacteraeota bacterium]|nr:hypothetical protein [Candidatus Dormibacteraeota bacterium]
MRVKLAASVALASALALNPVLVHAVSSPSPSLATVLAAPPASDFAQLTTSPLHGKFTAHDWANLSNSAPNATQTEATLNKDGFVDGYGMTWAQESSGHALIEAVMAFSGGRGAQDALTGMEASDKSDSTYKSADTVTGISPYYGAHFVDPSNQIIEDFFAFAKGNDVFGLAFVSTKDDILDAATKQVRTQYTSAPGLTIPRSQWPENATASASSTIGIIGAGIGFIVIVMGLVTFLVLRRRTPRASPSAFASYAPALSLQMSPDGNYWWDGQSWRDAAQSVPPEAQRSSDGAYWWDGRAWRPVPQPPTN